MNRFAQLADRVFELSETGVTPIVTNNAVIINWGAESAGDAGGVMKLIITKTGMTAYTNFNQVNDVMKYNWKNVTAGENVITQFANKVFWGY